MKIKQLIIENYKAIRGRKELTPNGASFFLLGGNGVGKTSVGHALMDLLTRSLPSQPITEGEQAGYMEFTMDNGAKLLGRFVEGKKPVLEFITPEGYNVGSPKELFAKLAGEGMAFDIDDFLKLQPKPLREKLEKIAGLNLSEISARENAAFEERKLANAQYRDQQGRVQPYDVNLVTKTLESSVEISGKIETLNREANLYNQLLERKETIALAIEDIQTEHANLVTDAEAFVSKQQRDLNLFLEKQKSDLSEFNQKVEEKKSQIATAKENALKNQDETNQKIAQYQAPDPSQIETLKTQLANVETTNAAILDAQRLHKEFEYAQELEIKTKNLDLKVKAIREEKEEKIKQSPIPAEGISFSETGDILIDGLPFQDNQISTSRKIVAGIQIACSMLGDIKYLHMDGAALDKENADRVLEYAEANGLQLCIERPIWEGGELKFEIADHTALPEAATARA